MQFPNISPSSLRPKYLSKDLKPSDVMAHILNRLKNKDQSGVWISTVNPEQAMDAARKLDNRFDEIEELPLYGMILSVKDCIDVEGEPTTSACPEFSYIAERSSKVVQLALEAGALYIGKTNMDQFATGLVGVRSPYGIARNPHNPDYIPGGSSSGAAVSIATDTSSIALGTDTGGSGRVPASYCGVTGFKPSPGSLSKSGMVYACRSFDTISLYTKAPLDSLIALKALAKYDDEDPYSIADYNISSLDSLDKDLANIKIATPHKSQRNFFGNSETEDLFTKAEQKAQALFTKLKEVDYSPFLSLNELMFFGPFVAERDVSVGDFLRKNGQAGHPIVRDIILQSNKWTAADSYKAQYQLQSIKRMVSHIWEDYDALMVPTVGTVYTIKEIEADPLKPNFNNGYYTNFANPLGLVGISIPSTVTKAGVPYGITFLGPPGSDTLIIDIANKFLNSKK